MRASRILTMMVVPLVLVSLGCSPSVSTVKVTKELNETSARELIKDRLSKETYKIPVDSIGRLFARTLTNYKTSNAVTGPQANLKRLRVRGLVLQRADIISYPKISGTFKVYMQGIECLDEHHVEILPNSNVLMDEVLRTGNRGEVSHWQETGTIEPDGKVEFSTPFGTSHGTYVEKGSAAYIEFPGPAWTPPPPPTRWNGSGTGKRVDVKWYTYSWSPDFQKQLVHVQNITYVMGGGFEVDAVSGLRLLTDTEATAKFAWKVSLNDLGKLFYPSQPPSEASQVTFGKKPDGTWFVDRLGISD